MMHEPLLWEDKMVGFSHDSEWFLFEVETAFAALEMGALAGIQAGNLALAVRGDK